MQEEGAVSALLNDIPLPELVRIIENQPNDVKHTVGAAVLLEYEGHMFFVNLIVFLSFFAFG